MGDFIVSIDIGSTKVSTVVGRVNKTNQLEVLCEGTAPCFGLKKGVIIDIESVSDSIKKSVQKAEANANIDIASAYVNIIGMHVDVVNKRASIDVGGTDREITSKDIERLLYSIRDIQIPEDKQLIDIIPRQYIIDGYDEIIDPVGMVGVKLEADADLVIGKITSVQNIVKSVERAGLKIDGLVIEAFALGEFMLSPEEKEMGTVIIDVGGGVTDLSVFKNKRLVYYDSIPVGGEHITNDISIGLKVSSSEAEKIKRQFELALTSLIENDQDFMINDINDNKRKNIRVSKVVEIIEARVFEIFSICRNMLSKANVTIDEGMNIILAGGGISYVDGCRQLAEEVFGIPARLGFKKSLEISKAELATATAMIRYVANTYKGGNAGSKVIVQKKREFNKDENSFLKKVAKFISRLF